MTTLNKDVVNKELQDWFFNKLDNSVNVPRLSRGIIPPVTFILKFVSSKYTSLFAYIYHDGSMWCATHLVAGIDLDFVEKYNADLKVINVKGEAEEQLKAFFDQHRDSNYSDQSAWSIDTPLEYLPLIIAATGSLPTEIQFKLEMQE